MVADPIMGLLLVLLLGLGAVAVLLLKHLLGVADRMADQEAQLSAERHARQVAEGNVARLRNRLLAVADTQAPAPGHVAGTMRPTRTAHGAPRAPHLDTGPQQLSQQPQQQPQQHGAETPAHPVHQDS